MGLATMTVSLYSVIWSGGVGMQCFHEASPESRNRRFTMLNSRPYPLGSAWSMKRMAMALDDAWSWEAIEAYGDLPRIGLQEHKASPLLSRSFRAPLR